MGKKKEVAPPELQPEKLRQITITNRKEFLALKSYLVSRNKYFIWTAQGSVNGIIYNGKEFSCVDLKQTGGQGHHLNRPFKKDVEEWIENNPGALKPYAADYKMQMFNLGAIEQSVGKPRVAIDLNDCYWKTAYKLGYSTEKTYIAGLRKKEWKVGRNACIGSLVKVKRFTPYVPGEYVRNHIIGYVYHMFYRLYEEIGDHFCMFLTDCVITDYKTKKQVEAFFASYGYKCKSKPVEFTAVDRGKKVIHWYDFTEKVYNDAGVVTGHGADKYYNYASHQVIDGTRAADVHQTPQ
jgi:hypothetical protein